MITLVYTTIDGVYKRRQYKKVESAKKFVDHWLGDGEGGLLAEISGGGYSAIAYDGVGRIDAQGINLRELYPAR